MSPIWCPHVLLNLKSLLGFDFKNYDCYSKTKKSVGLVLGLYLSLTVNYRARVL